MNLTIAVILGYDYSQGAYKVYEYVQNVNILFAKI